MGLDSRRLCLPVEQPGFPNCSRVQGSMSHQTPGPEVQKWHSAELQISQSQGNHQALVVSPYHWYDKVWMYCKHDMMTLAIWSILQPTRHITKLLCVRALVMMRLGMIGWWQLYHTSVMTNTSCGVTGWATQCYNIATEGCVTLADRLTTMTNTCLHLTTAGQVYCTSSPYQSSPRQQTV